MVIFQGTDDMPNCQGKSLSSRYFKLLNGDCTTIRHILHINSTLWDIITQTVCRLQGDMVVFVFIFFFFGDGVR